MSLNGDHHSVQFQVYRGTLDLLLKQCMSVYNEAFSCGILLDIKAMFDQHHTSSVSSPCDKSTSMENSSNPNSIVLPGLPLKVKPVERSNIVGK